MNKKTKYAFSIFISLFCISIATILVIFILNKENPWIPSVQGSYVIEMEYEEINGDYEYLTYVDYNSFKNTSIANYHFIPQKQAKDERYSKEFFKTRDLAIIKFNRDESKINYSIIDAVINDKNCIVKLLEIKRIGEIEKTPATYYCFFETEKDLANLSINLIFEKEVQHDSQSFNYINMQNKFYFFEGETNPIIYRIDDVQGLNDFIEEDPVLTTENYIYNILSRYPNNAYENMSLVLIRIPSSDFEKWVAYFDQDKIFLTGVRSNHYLYGNETKFHSLISMLIPKESSILKIEIEKYHEYEDDITSNKTNFEFDLIASTITESMMRYDIE